MVSALILDSQERLVGNICIKLAVIYEADIRQSEDTLLKSVGPKTGTAKGYSRSKTGRLVKKATKKSGSVKTKR